MMPFNPFKEKYLKNCWADLILRLSYEYWLVLLVFSNSLYLFLTNSKIQKVELIKFQKLELTHIYHPVSYPYLCINDMYTDNGYRIYMDNMIGGKIVDNSGC